MLVVRQSIELSAISTLSDPVFHAAAFQPHHENPDIRRRHARDARRLAECRGPNLHKLLPRLGSQTGDHSVIETLGDLFVLHVPELDDLVFLAGNIAGILDRNLNLSDYYI
jgi:hypothetical protein